MRFARPDAATAVEHVIELPQCCPVSRNPLPGSTLAVRYRPTAGRVLDVYDLTAWAADFVGGHPGGTREMEQMVQDLAARAAQEVAAPVRAVASLLIAAPDPRKPQRMRVVVRARP